MQQNSPKDEIESAFISYMHSYFVLRDIENVVLDYWSQNKNVSSFGLSLKEVQRDLESIEKQHQNERDTISNSIHINYEFFDTHVINENAGYVIASFDIKSDIEEFPLELFNLRTTTIFQKIKGKWKIIHTHISNPSIFHEENETYPLKLIHRMTEIMEDKVKEETFMLKKKIEELNSAMNKVNTLKKLLPICSYCKNIKDVDDEAWMDFENYITKKTASAFSHAVCEDCENKLMDRIDNVQEEQSD